MVEKTSLKGEGRSLGLHGVNQLIVAGDKTASSEGVEPMTLIPGVYIVRPNITMTNVIWETKSGFKLIRTPRTKVAKVSERCPNSMLQ